MENKMEDYLAKFNNFELNVNELRSQLDQVTAERAQLIDTVASCEQSVCQLRKEKTAAVEERDSLMKVIERQQAELERLKQDLHTYQQQLSSAITAKCEAIARVDEIQSKEVALELKESRLESERHMLQQEIQLLSGDLNRNQAELQNIRREHSLNVMQLESRLKEKTDALKLVQKQYGQAVKTIEELHRKVEAQNDVTYKQNQATEEYVERLKKELDAKEKLFNIFKNTEADHLAQREELLQGISKKL